MTESRFSREHGFENASAHLGDSELPEWVRDEVFYLYNRLALGGRAETLIRSFIDKLAHALRPILRRYTERGPSPSPARNETLAATRYLISNSDFNVAFDICQEIYRAMLDVYGADIVGQFTLELNKVFEDAGVVWRMDGADFKRVMDSSTEDSIAASQTALADSRFQAPKDQFNLAIKQFSERPEPNVKDCINNAIGSLEGVARVVTGKIKVLSSLLNEEPLKSRIHPALRDAMQKVYAYRGDVTAHGQTGVQSSSYGLEEAEWLMGICATSIAYISKKFPTTTTPAEEDTGIS